MGRPKGRSRFFKSFPGLLEQIARDQGIDAGRLEVWFCDEPYAAIPRAAHAEPWAASPVSVRRRSWHVTGRELPKIVWGWAAAGRRLRSVPPYLGDAQCCTLNILSVPPPVLMMPHRSPWTPRCSWRWSSACRAGSSWPARRTRTRRASTVLRPATVRACSPCWTACACAPSSDTVIRWRSLSCRRPVAMASGLTACWKRTGCGALLSIRPRLR